MKHVVITGSTRGIGKGLAEQFLAKGHKVTINGTNERSLENTLKILKEKYNENIQGFVGNVINYKEMEELYKRAVNGFGPVDIWINNAGIDQEGKSFIDCDINKVHEVIDINLKGVMNGTQVALKNMQKQGYGFIYNTQGYGSNGAIMSRMSIYGTTKRAINYFTQSVAKEIENTNIKIGVLSPGMVMTDILKNGIPEDEKERNKFINVCNILADKVEDVTPFLADKMLENNKNNIEIKWLTSGKASLRFLTAKFNKRNLFEN
jgi:short-subunit dehydrogenase